MVRRLTRASVPRNKWHVPDTTHPQLITTTSCCVFPPTVASARLCCSSAAKRRRRPSASSAAGGHVAIMSLRVAVIGAGGAGLAAARELRREGLAAVVYERAAGVGGTWVYDGDDADGQSTSTLYASLRTTLPREVMGFLDVPFVAGQGSVDARRFPGHREVLRYVEDLARRFDLYSVVRLRTEVLSVRRNNDGVQDQLASSSSWRVRWRRLGTRHDDEEVEEEEVFDAVVVCNGHYTEPRVADIPGVDAWPGKQMHSRSYRVPEPFAGQVVVIIGAKNSGSDISRDIASVAKEVHIANRSAPAATCERLPGYHNLWLRSMVEHAEEDGRLVFRDGSCIKADVIMHCTGYKYSFPFLGDDASIAVDGNRVDPLYKHVFPPHVAPHLSFIGLPFKVIPFPMFQLQSSWVAGVLSGRIQLPPKDEMMQDVRAWYSEMEAAGWPKGHTHCLLHNQFEYADWLAEQCGHPKLEEWRKHMYDAVCKKKVHCSDTYREEWEDHHLLEQAYQDFRKYMRVGLVQWIARLKMRIFGRTEIPTE
ncbi:hypothetical protein ACP4OV_022477 [Aristida adscensionis]